MLKRVAVIVIPLSQRYALMLAAKEGAASCVELLILTCSRVSREPCGCESGDAACMYQSTNERDNPTKLQPHSSPQRHEF